MRKSTRVIAVVFLLSVVFGNFGCIGTMIWAGGEDFEFSEKITTQQLHCKFGSPTHVEYIDPPKVPKDIPILLFDEWPPELKSRGPVSRLETYRYVGPRKEHPDAVTMSAGVETAWSLMTLGLYELYNVPRMMKWKSNKNDDVTTFVVAFDNHDQYIYRRLLEFDSNVWP